MSLGTGKPTPEQAWNTTTNSVTVLAANATETVLAAASNVRGAWIVSASVQWTAVAAVVQALRLVINATAPATFIGTTAMMANYVIVGATPVFAINNQADLPFQLWVPAGQGVFWHNIGAAAIPVSTTFRSVVLQVR